MDDEHFTLWVLEAVNTVAGLVLKYSVWQDTKWKMAKVQQNLILFPGKPDAKQRQAKK